MIIGDISGREISGEMIDAGNEINREEIQNLLNIVRRDLKDSEVKG